MTCTGKNMLRLRSPILIIIILTCNNNKIYDCVSKEACTSVEIPHLITQKEANNKGTLDLRLLVHNV
jgi:hypothetical protein